MRGLANFCFAFAGLYVAVAVSGCATTPESGTFEEKLPAGAAANERNVPLAPTSVEALKEFEAAPTSGYQLGPGDVVDVTLWGHPELSGKHTIGPDGKIQIPFVGSLKITDMTADRAGEFITAAVSEDYKGPVATVQIDEYTNNKILVLGHVSQPGVLQFADQPTLLEALARASGSNGTSLGTSLTPLTRCAVFRGRDRIAWIDLRRLLRGQNPLLNIRLMQNDIVYVPDLSDQLIYVMGQVNKPGAYPLTPDMSFLEALASAGGPTDMAQPNKIILARPHLQEIIDLENYLKGKDVKNNRLETGDIIYVPKNGIAKIGWVLQQINPITQGLLFGAALF